MSRVRAAKIIAQDLRVNNEKRRKRIKQKASQYSNQHEFLQSTNRKRGTNVTGIDIDLLADLEDSEMESEQDSEEDLETTRTAMLYKELMKDRKFLFTFQPRMLDGASSDEEGGGEGSEADQVGDGEKKLGQLEAGESLMITKSQANMQISQVQDISSSQVIDKSIEKNRQMHPEERELQDALRYRWYIIRKSSSTRAYWDYTVMSLAIWNCIWTPLTISFDWAIQVDQTDMFQTIDYIVLSFYTVDIIVQFLTSYINTTTGDEIMKPSYIARRYFHGEFLVDFMSTFPFRKFTLAETNAGYKVFSSVCQLLKALRVRKLYSVIAASNLTIQSKALTKIGFYSFLIFIYTHIIGCVMWFMLKENYLWVAPTDFGAIRSRMQDPWYQAGQVSDAGKTSEMRKDYQIFIFQWLSMWYHSALSLALVEVTARTQQHILILILCYIINAIFNAILFGIYFELIVEAKRKQNEFQTRVDDANTAMANLNLPEELAEHVRNYILQTDLTRTEQNEFIEFAESMPPSKQKSINALIFKKMINKSTNFGILRLAMRDHHRKKMHAIHDMDIEDPNVEKIDIDKGEREFRKLISYVVSQVKVMHVRPEEIIVMQSDIIKDEQGEYIDDKAKFYLILNGDFKVSTLKFNKQKHKKKNKDAKKAVTSKSGKGNEFKKVLGPGEYFGEVAFLFDCGRTSTIKAKLYSTLGTLNHEQTNSLLTGYPIFKNHLKNDVVRVYDDDLKLFLMHALRRVDYLANVKDEIIVQLAYMCVGDIREKGSVLHDMDEEPENQLNDELVIIFDGACELYLVMDAGTEFRLELLTAGSVINSHNMLVQRKHSVNVRFTQNTMFYYLKYSKLVQVARNYPAFAKELLKEKGMAEALKSRDQNPIDYLLGIEFYTDAHDRVLDKGTSQKVIKIMAALKNSVIYLLLKNRKDRKVKNLRKILEEFIQRKNKQKEMQRVKKRELEDLPLDEKLEKMIGDDKILTEIQYENVSDLMSEIVTESIEQNFTQLRLLKSNFEQRLLKRGSGKSVMADQENIEL